MPIHVGEMIHTFLVKSKQVSFKFNKIKSSKAINDVSFSVVLSIRSARVTSQN